MQRYTDTDEPDETDNLDDHDTGPAPRTPRPALDDYRRADPGTDLDAADLDAAAAGALDRQSAGRFLYAVTFNTHSGMTIPLWVAVPLDRARKSAARQLRHFRRLYPCCRNRITRLTAGAEWELSDCGRHLISDLHGFLTIRPIRERAQ